MKKRLILGLLLVMSLGLAAQNPSTRSSMNKYEQQWKQIEKFEKDDLPKSASQVTDQILTSAIAGKNTPQVIKALIYKNKYKIQIDREESTQIFSDLENLLQSSENLSDKALLHSMLAELYLDYCSRNMWTIRNRTAITGFVPEDVKEWSKNIFEDKAIAHLSASVTDKQQLLAIATKSYEDIIVPGEDSQRLDLTLYDLLMGRAIEQSVRITSDNERNTAFLKALQVKGLQIKDLAVPTEQFVKLDFSGDENLLTLQYYKEHLQSLLDRNINEAVVLDEIGRNNYLTNRSENYRNKYSLDFLTELEKKNRVYDYNVEIINSLADLYQSNTYGRYEVNDPANDEQAEKKYRLLKYGIENYPNYKRINLLKRKLQDLESPYAQIEGRAIFHPNNPEKKFKLTYKNLSEATIKVIDKKTRAVVEAKKIALSPKTTYSVQEMEFILEVEKTGDYRLVAEYDKKTDKNESPVLHISRLASFARVSGDDNYEFYVVDRMTGIPVEGVAVTVYSTDWENKSYTRLSSVSTNTQGLAELNTKDLFKDKNQRRYVYKVSKGDDAINEYNDFPYYYNYSPPSTIGQDLISIMTDRSIYRPGQTVYYKVISTKELDNTTIGLNSSKEYKVTLYNVNSQMVSEKTLVTNEFGSLAGEFVLPQDGLTGQYRIEVDNANQYFSVEEYKRPTFQITFDKQDKTYTFGDAVTIKGHAENFSGIKLQGATVEYTIVKSPMMRWWMPSGSDTVDQGTVVTQDDGSFDVVFTIPQNDTRKGWFNSIFNFNIEASVTDLNGETQTGNFSFSVGDVSMILSASIPDKLDKDSKEKIRVKATNLSGDTVYAEGTYSIYSVLPNDSIKEKVYTGSFSTKSDTDLMPQIAKLPSAKYLMELNTKDDKGRDVVSRNYFVLYSVNDKTPPIRTNEWIVEIENHFDASKDAEILFGVSAEDVTVLYDILKKNKVLSREQLKLSHENKRLKIPYKQEYGENVVLALTYVINDTSYIKQITLTKEEIKKNLNLKFEVFRDKLRPGQKEEWRISVKDNENKPAFAELLASMYDSSLDKIRPTTPWQLREIVKPYEQTSVFSDNSYGSVSDYTYFPSKNYYIKDFKWDYLNWFGFSVGLNYYGLTGSVAGIRIRGGSSMKKESSPEVIMLQENAVVVEDRGLRATAPASGALMDKVDESYDSDVEESSLENGMQPQIRSNFNETAFFYPQLKTNEAGETIISFTVPESNTIWKFRALAYDKNLNTGNLEALAVSRKELMVTPNMPRFIRQGDKTGISTKISNLSDQAQGGKVRIEFFDPLNDQRKNIPVFDQYQDFNLEKDASASVTWMFDVPEDIDMLGVRIVAESGNFSDGEQHVVPVLPNRMLVTESMTMNVNGPQTKTFELEKLADNTSSSLSNYRLTLEFAGNPAWYAVQALPALSNPTNENAVNWFASYFVNTLGSAITVQYPKVTNMIKAWKMQGGNSETLMSNLQKNEELKSVLLEETPWVLDAKNESEQMDRLSLLFDLNNTSMQTSMAINKLKELQNADGGWSWYKDMYSSRSVTQYILYGFTELIHLGAMQYPSDVKVMQMSALKYIDKKIREDFDELKKNNKDWEKSARISTNQLEYLFVRSSYRDIPIDQPTRTAERAYTDMAEKNWTGLNLYEKSLLVIVSQRNGKKDLAGKILQSLREHATVNEEMGMFWANNRNTVFMGNSAVAVHTFIMDAFKEMDAAQNEMDRMKQWLLKQKQTQIWETTHATIEAIHALLSTGSDWLASSGDVKITVGKETVKQDNKELGTGYIKETWSSNEFTRDMAKVQVEKTDNGPAWGALYWQYYEDLDKISDQSGELNIDKKIFIERSDSSGKMLVEVTEENPLRVGDKVIMRLTVRADRDFEFVNLKDMRASCFEPVETISGLRWNNSTYYYQSTKDVSTNFYFDRLNRGTYVFEYAVYANRVGEYSNGITTIQCMYAPEYVSHTAGMKVTVK